MIPSRLDMDTDRVQALARQFGESADTIQRYMIALENEINALVGNVWAGAAAEGCRTLYYDSVQPDVRQLISELMATRQALAEYVEAFYEASRTYQKAVY